MARLELPDPLLVGRLSADMRHFCARGIPCAMLGPSGFERAHAADEFVSVDDLVRVARAIAVTILRSGHSGH